MIHCLISFTLFQMSASSEAKSVVSLILEKLSYRAFQALVQITEILVHNKKPKGQVSASTQNRIRFISGMLKLMLDEAYEEDVILWCHNALIADMKVRRQSLHVFFSTCLSSLPYFYTLDEVSWRIDLAGIIQQYKQLHPDDEEASRMNVVRLLPFQTVCNCGKQLSVEFVTTAHVLYPDSIQPCSLYESTCKICSRTYRVSSIYLSAEKLSIVTPESLKVPFFHLSCDKIVFSRELLVSFSSLPINGHVRPLLHYET